MENEQRVQQIAQNLGISPENWTEFVQTLRSDDGLKTYFDNGPSSLKRVYDQILTTVPAGQTAGHSGSAAS